MKTILCCTILIAFVSPLLAEEIRLKSGGTLEATKVEKTETGLTITTKNAEVDIGFERLAEPTARKYFPERFIEADKLAKEKAEAARLARLKQIEDEQKLAAEKARQTLYEKEKASFFVINGQFVEKDKLTEIRGVIREKHNDGTLINRGLHNAAGGGNALLRPGVQIPQNWVFLKDYSPRQEAGQFIEGVFGMETNAVDGVPAFDVGRTPTIEEWEKWKAAKAKKPAE